MKALDKYIAHLADQDEQFLMDLWDLSHQDDPDYDPDGWIGND